MGIRKATGLSFRSAREADLDRLLAIHLAAFPDPRGETERRTNFMRNVRGKLADLVVAERGGEIFAHGFLFETTGFFGGTEVKVGLIASVGVAQEARGSGVGSALVDALHERSKKRGDVLTTLYPFRYAFYAAHGYGPVSHYRELGVDPACIPLAWSKSLEKSGLRAMRVTDRAAVEALFRDVARRSTGRYARTEAFWDRLFLDERRAFFVVEREKRIAGFLSASLLQEEAHARTTLDVHEVTAADDDAKRALFGWIGAQRGQVALATIELDASDPIDRAFVDPDASSFGTLALEHPFGRVANGPVVRIHDAKRAIEARGYLADGEATVAVEGAGAFEVNVRGGRARARSSRKKPDLVLSRASLSSLLYGGLTPTELIGAGLCRSRGEAQRLDPIFRIPPFFALDPF